MIKDDQKTKKIDFKEKAIMAKEASLKKVANNAQKQANAGGGNGPNMGAKKKY